MGTFVSALVGAGSGLALSYLTQWHFDPIGRWYRRRDRLRKERLIESVRAALGDEHARWLVLMMSGKRDDADKVIAARVEREMAEFRSHQ